MEVNFIKCPRCESKLRITQYPDIITDNISSTVGGRRARTKKVSKGRTEVQQCECGIKEREVLEIINKSNEPTKDDVLKRLEEDGLPTRV